MKHLALVFADETLAKIIQRKLDPLDARHISAAGDDEANKVLCEHSWNLHVGQIGQNCTGSIYFPPTSSFKASKPLRDALGEGKYGRRDLTGSAKELVRKENIILQLISTAIQKHLETNTPFVLFTPAAVGEEDPDPLGLDGLHDVAVHERTQHKAITLHDLSTDRYVNYNVIAGVGSVLLRMHQPISR